MHPRKNPLSTIMLFLLIAIFCSLLNISKIFIIPGCSAFDANDDANHTLVNLHEWRRILSDGEWPMMNVYNNFGTPLIGDATTYPLSPLAITHAFLPLPLAMAINRSLAASLSLFLLFMFYHRRFSKAVSLGLGICTFYASGFLWHSAHHHFQMFLLLLVAFFLSQEDFTRKITVGGYLKICILSIVMFMSISINVVAIMCLLILGYQAFLSSEKKFFGFILSGLLCGVLAALPDILIFAQAIERSMRISIQYPILTDYGPHKIFLTPIALATIYCLFLLKEKSYREGSLFLLLGVLPCGAALLSKVLPSLWQKIPLLGSTDIVRLTWGANIFVMLAFGKILLRWSQYNPWSISQVFLCCLAINIDIFFLPFHQEWAREKLFLEIVFRLICLGFVGYAVINTDRARKAAAIQWMVRFLGGVVVSIFLYQGFFDVLGFFAPQTCRAGERPAFSLNGSEKFPLQEILAVIPRNSRVAYDFMTTDGLDLRGSLEGLFGAGARSTIMSNRNFARKLSKAELIKFDSYTGDYHFSQPWRSVELQALGISYAVQKERNDTLLTQGWKNVGKQEGPFLYQNPHPTGVVFLKNGKDVSPLPFFVKGNGLNIELPLSLKKPQYLIASLLKIPGWQAWIDNKRIIILQDDNNFLKIPILPNDRFVKIRYAPFPSVLIFLSLLTALTFPYIIIKKFLIGK